MRFFELLHVQHVAGSILVPVIFMVLFAVGLKLMPLINSKDDQGKKQPIQRFNDNIEKAEGPFPLVMALILVGTIVWGIFYIFYYGFSEVIL